jgi:DNA-binding LacI/PurR family transcriptional regulator
MADISGTARPSAMSDVAALAGVSHQTVSRVINGHAHVAPETRERVERAIAELGYRPNSAARALVTGSARTVGLIAFNISQYGPAQTMLGLERAARAAGYHVSITVLDEATAAAMQEAVERLASQSVDAIVALATYADAFAAVQEVRTSIPVVTVQAQSDDGLAVWVDQQAGGRLATRHLLSLGHRTVHHVAGPLESLDAQRRVEGWQGELADAGITPPEPLRGDWTPASGHRAGVELVRRIRESSDSGPTAVFVGNDQMALGVLKALHEAGLSVPRDVSVVGFDDIPEASFFTPALTTVRQDFAEVGRRGMDLALSAATQHPVAVDRAVETLLVERGSTAAFH